MKDFQLIVIFKLSGKKEFGVDFLQRAATHGLSADILASGGSWRVLPSHNSPNVIP
jgi:hypothetical protein